MHRRRTLAAAAPLACAFAVVACSSGADSSKGNGNGAFSLDRDTVEFSVVENAEAPASKDVRIQITGSDAALLEVGYPVGTPVPSWLDLALNGSGFNFTLSMWVTSTTLAPGVYPTTLRVVTGRRDGTVLASRDIRVTYTVATGVSALPLVTMPTNGVAGSSVAPGARPIHVVGTAGTAWTATSDAAWAVPGKAAGTVPDQFDVSFVSDGLPPGTYTAHVTVGGGGTSASVIMTLTLTAPSLDVTPGTVALGGSSGHDLGGRVAKIVLGTGTNAYPLTAIPADAWLEVSLASSTVSASAAAVTVAPGAGAAVLPLGTYTSHVTVSAEVCGQTLTRTVPVTLTLDDHRMLVNRTGVALTTVPGVTTLTRALEVRSNRGLTPTWTATSDQAWLSVTAGGSTADPLVLTADPSALASDALHEATVTITPDVTGGANVEHVRVGLWVGSTAPDALTIVTTAFKQLAADPVRPYFYANGGGTDITVLHAYTGATVATFAAIGEQLGAMAVSGDGSRLFVVDQGATPRIVPVDLRTGAAGTAWPLPSLVKGTGAIAYARSNGIGLVVVGNGELRDAATGTVHAAQGAGGMVTASQDGSMLCGVTYSTYSPFDLTCRSLDVTSTTGAAVVGGSREEEWGNRAAARDVALSADGSRAYVPDAFVNTIFGPKSPGTTMPDLGNLVGDYPVAVEVGADERIFAATWDRGVNHHLLVYGPDGVQQGSFALGAEPFDGQLAVTGDGKRVAVLTGRFSVAEVRILTVP